MSNAHSVLMALNNFTMVPLSLYANISHYDDILSMTSNIPRGSPVAGTINIYKSGICAAYNGFLVLTGTYESCLF